MRAAGKKIAARLLALVEEVGGDVEPPWRQFWVHFWFRVTTQHTTTVLVGPDTTVDCQTLSSDLTHSDITADTVCTRSWDLLARPQLVKKFLVFYGTRRFITTFTTARHLSQFRVLSIQSTTPSYFFKIYFNIILPSIPRSLSGLFTFVSRPAYRPILWLLRN
jgi:hypothetical protein